MPRRFDNPVEVPTAVFDGLETVQESRETSMLGHQAVLQDIANCLGYPGSPRGSGSTGKRIWRAFPAAS